MRSALSQETGQVLTVCKIPSGAWKKYPLAVLSTPSFGDGIGVLWSHRLCGEGPGRRKVVKKTFEAPIPEFLHSKREVTLGDSGQGGRCCNNSEYLDVSLGLWTALCLDTSPGLWTLLCSLHRLHIAPGWT